ncbi:Ankyrin repeat-containing domain [Penicillium camemberti]|uniref:Ankyrin repeat-containing domain n=1 Tax=Penicillium camemberti (strain FM 013) TaxID=1429867 RepID=A0A0G4PV47_PENC3|nr:Ankyrin repeat-containing domain [Penicillium camemberti]
MSVIQIHPSVDVIWWTDTDFYIKCPYCEELHRHGFVSYESALRVPHCGMPRPSYRFEFPNAYEIDKNKARFININTLEYLESEAENGSEDGSEDETFLSGGISSMNISETSNGSHQIDVTFADSTEQITFQLDGEEPFNERRILFAISDCVSGEVSGVRNYLEQTEEKSIFLHGKDHRGDTCLIMASREENPIMVSLLLDYGADINAVNKNGRTALMEASLWGRLEIATILLSRGADRYLYDKKLQRALDLTHPTQRNRKERHTVAGGIWGDLSKDPIYREATLNRDSDRREIARVLCGREVHTEADLELQESETTYHSFRRSLDGQSVAYYGPIRRYPISSSVKTVAVLEKGRPFPSIAAMSGWGHSEWPSIRVSGRDWTALVLKLATIVGHTLSAHAAKDQGIQGQFQASHAEKQLIAYFLDRHVFLQQDKTPNPQFDEEIDNQESKIEEMASRFSTIRQMHRLQKDREQVLFDLWNKDDRLLGDEYDEEAVKGLKTNVACLGEKIGALELRPEVRQMRARERQIRLKERQKGLHERLNRMSAKEPERTLRRATILISAPTHGVCEDCLLFGKRVNHFFGLQIELRECTM